MFVFDEVQLSEKNRIIGYARRHAKSYNTNVFICANITREVSQYLSLDIGTVFWLQKTSSDKCKGFDCFERFNSIKKHSIIFPSGYEYIYTEEI